jgi:sigma-E factor negative regulatory protein RseA
MIDKTRRALALNIDERQAISDLADGRIGGQAFVDAVELVGSRSDGHEVWHRYHLIGDAMRGVDALPNQSGVDFVSGFRAKLALEPVFPRAARVGELQELRRDTELTAKPGKSANDGVFRWRMLAGLASLTAVLAVGWNMVEGFKVHSDAPMASLTGTQVDQPAVANLGNAIPAVKGPQVMLRDPHLDALMAAHKQFGGTSALQMPAGFIRNATFESDSK